MAFGPNNQEFDLLVDTGSSWTWTYADECIEVEGWPCPANNFHYQMSAETSGDEVRIVYGNSEATGLKMLDLVSIPQNEQIAARVEFLGVPDEKVRNY